MALYDGFDNENDPFNQPVDQTRRSLQPGDPGFRMSPWAPGYDPGPNWNNGLAPEPSNVWNTSTNTWDTAAQSMGAVKGPTADENTNMTGRGLPPQPRTEGTPPPTGNGSVPSIGGGRALPSASLPGDIQGLFNQKPEKTPIQGAYQDALLKYMGRSQETPSLNDSILGPQTEVYRATQQRNQERNRRVNAERAAATGRGESGYLDNLINQGVQEQGFNTAQFNANLLGGEMNKRREELQAALQLASATGNAEAARELQQRLAQVSAMMQQQGLNLQGQLGFGDLDLRWALGSEGLNQNALQLAMRALD